MYLAEINKLIEDFNLYLYRSNGKFTGCCPIHNGDNPTAFNINVNSGYFFCNTAGCHTKVENNLEGFIWALLSSRINGIDFESGELCDRQILDDYLEKNNISVELNDEATEKTYEPKISKEFNLPLSYLDNHDLGNCAFFLNRGYERYILKKHAVFTCGDPTKEFYHLCIVPIFDIKKSKIIGITARMPYERCLICNAYHNPAELCQDIAYASYNPKWQHHPKGFIKTNYLYNLWNSWRYIKLYQSMIVVESPGSVFKLEQCGFLNSVAVLGSTFAYEQRKLIDKLNPKNILVIGDNDDDGNKLVTKVQEFYPIAQSLELDKVNDIGNLEDKELTELIWRKLL